jgi:hypothetical protein
MRADINMILGFICSSSLRSSEISLAPARQPQKKSRSEVEGSNVILIKRRLQRQHFGQGLIPDE